MYLKNLNKAVGLQLFSQNLIITAF